FRRDLIEKRHAFADAIRRYPDGASSPPLRGTFWLVVIPALLLYLVNGRSIASYDNFPTNMTAAALVLDGTFDAGERFGLHEKGGPCPTAVPYSMRCTAKGIYSLYPAGMLAFSIPVFFLSRIMGGNLVDARVQWRLAKWAGAWLAALTLGF